MFTRGERIGQASVVILALVFAYAVGGFLFGRGGGGAGPATTTPSATPRAPEVTFAQDTCCTQTARFMKIGWTVNEKVNAAKLTLVPDPGFPCEATVEASGLKGTLSCQGLLRGATDYVANLSLVTARGTYPYQQKFRTMGDRLTNVKWFTEFEDPKGDPLACAAASVRIVQNYTTGTDPVTATQILQQGQPLNRSKDTGIDPVAIASMQKKLSATNNYHYYRFATREEATKSAIYWLVRSGKPVHVISLAGQHDPLLVGFTGTFGTYYDDPNNAFTQLVVEDPQRGDLNPLTASRRPDKPRSEDFQTGHPVDLSEWYRDEWWLGFAYATNARQPDGSYINIERNDGAYPTPHWANQFVILVDDGDTDWPSDKEGRVKWH